MSSSSSRQKTLLYAAAAWMGVGACTFAVRAAKRRANRKREAKVLAAGGLIPGATNVVAALATRASRDGEKSRTALVSADGKTYSWQEYYLQVRAFAAALLAENKTAASAGSPPSFGVAVHAFNCPEWFFAALGAMHAGSTVSGIYTTNTYEQAAHILKTSAVRVLVLEDEEQLASTYGTLLADFPAVTAVLLRGGDDSPRSRTPSYAAFVARGSRSSSSSSKKSSTVVLPAPEQLSGDAVTSLVYTSGTTGNPKAVELTHANVHAVCAMMHARIPLSEKTVVVSYLPLSHIAAQGIDIMSAVYCGATVHFADADALKGSLKQTLKRVRPTLFFGVPRVWEKMQAAMLAVAAEKYAKPGVGPVLKTIGSAAKAVGAKWYDPDTSEALRCFLLAPPFFLSRALVYKKARLGCGLDRCPLLYTGAAPLSPTTAAYLRSIDMPLLEVFGMSESCGAIAVSGPNDLARPLDACGAALPGGSLEILPDGEVCWRGANNFKGYKGMLKATAEALEVEGGSWKSNTGNSGATTTTTTTTTLLHTGDLGVVDPATGYLRITGRKKDLIITAGGENVAPSPIEQAFVDLLRGAAAHAILVGEGRKFLVVLLAPPEDATAEDATPPLDEAAIRSAVEAYNRSYAKSRAQRVQMAAALPAFSVAGGELTPTMKVKRAAVVERSADLVEAMYSGEVATRAAALAGYTSIVL